MTGRTTETLRQHVSYCRVCSNNPFGLCSVGFLILGTLLRKREQPELDLAGVMNRPLVKMFARQNDKYKTT